MEFLAQYWSIGLFLVGIIVVLLIILRPAPSPEKFESPWHHNPAKSFSVVKVDDELSNINLGLSFGEQEQHWQEQMHQHAKKIKQAGVSHVFFVNGTYAGFDPIDLIGLLKMMIRRMPERLELYLRGLSLGGLNKLVKDCGNFLNSYCELFSQALGGIPCENFKWSSANHHAARLEAALLLMRRISETAVDSEKSSQRILLIGHSHAGQVFSLMTQLLDKSCNSHLIAIASEFFVPREEIKKYVTILSRMHFDFVTLGMPPRYSWRLNPKMRLLHLINHRGSSHVAGSLRGILHTIDGDYVQQAGIRGTDTQPWIPKLRLANSRLNDILDGGSNIKQWMTDIKLKNRIPKYGYTYLVDYNDVSRGVPNLFRTIFGHGTYTEAKYMEFNTRIIVEYLYS